MTHRRILVTGGTGFIGVPTTDQFVTAGEDVVVLDNFEVGERSRLDHLADRPNLEVVEVDLRDQVAVERTVHEIAPTHVVHLAAQHFIPFCVAHPAETIAVNVGGTQHLLDALVAVEPRRIVFASTAHVYQSAPHAHVEVDSIEPNNIYGASKRMGEQLLDFHVRRCPETDVVVCRFFNALGPGETNPHLVPDIMDHLREGDELPLGNVDTRRDYIFTGDMARALHRLADGPEGSFTVNLGSGRSWTARELVERLAVLLDRDLQIATDPDKVRPSDRPVLQASTRRLQMLLPNFSLTTLDDALRATLIGEGFDLPV
ncbi:MAG: NAD-dependent epimerase/dehydratase family protein, partial [Actinomycetota bacterium]|nr:NAD-dependent epimerase/dehydratase family protein [Actinomycetota bacterium]